MKKYAIIIILICCLFGCKKEDLETSMIVFKGNIMGEKISLNENNLLLPTVIDLDEPFNIRAFVSMFENGNTSYQLSFTIPKDSVFNSLLFPVQQTGKYGFEKISGNNLSALFRFNVVEKTDKDFIFYTSYSNNDDNNVEILNIEFETDTTLIISGAFDCNLTFLTNSETVGTANNVEFVTRFLIK